MEIIGKDLIEMWRGKTVVKMKNDFTGLIRRLNISKESVNLMVVIWNWNRMEKIFEHPRTISSILIYINWNSNKKRESKQKRVLEEIITNSFIRTMENIKLQIQEFQRTPSKIKRKNSYAHHIQATENQRERENVLGSQRKKVYHRRRKVRNTSTSIQTHSPVDNGVTFSKEKEKSTPNSVSSKSAFQKWRQNKYFFFFQVNENWETDKLKEIFQVEIKR